MVQNKLFVDEGTTEFHEIRASDLKLVKTYRYGDYGAANLVTQHFLYDPLSRALWSNEGPAKLLLDRITPGTVTVASVLIDLCARVGAGVPVTTGITDTLEGYVIGRPTTARAAIEQLMTAFFFDAVESDGLIKFVKRGGANVATIAYDDLTAHEDGQTMPAPLEETRLQELELPQELALAYTDPTTDYQVGVQRSRRLTTQSREQARVELGIVMSSGRAATIVQVMMQTAWRERMRLRFSLGPEYAHLEPTDPIRIETPTGAFDVRLTKVDYGLHGLLRCEALSEDIELYASVEADNDAAADDQQTLGLTGPTLLHLLDLPILRDV
ncbi:MAG: phage tail protein, partial [Gammaproteobacteria bacterium]